MSLLYKLFGVPRTFDEFVDKIKKRRDRKVRVALVTNVMDEMDGRPTFRYSVEIHSGRARLRLSSRIFEMIVPNLEYTKGELRGLTRDLLREGIGIAERLKQQGLEVTVGKENYSIERAREELRKYETAPDQ